jgi:hypothetical protein
VTTRDGRSGDFTYDVALSFAGEQRTYVEKVAAALRRRGRRPFYDDYEKAELGEKIFTSISTGFIRRLLATAFCSPRRTTPRRFGPRTSEGARKQGHCNRLESMCSPFASMRPRYRA